MKLTAIAAKPQLVKIVLDDEATVQEYGEPVEFWTLDRQPLDIFMKLASANQSDTVAMIGIVKTMILDENGKEVISNDNMLPSTLLIKVIEKIVASLGK